MISGTVDSVKEVVLDDSGRLRYVMDRTVAGALQVTVFNAADKAALVKAGALPQGTLVRDFNSLKPTDQAAVIAGLPEMGKSTNALSTAKVVEMQEALARAAIAKQLEAAGVPFKIEENGNIFLTFKMNGQEIGLEVNTVKLDRDGNLLEEGTVFGQNNKFILMSGQDSIANAIMPLQSLSGDKGQFILLISQDQAKSYEMLSVTSDKQNPDELKILSASSIDAQKVSNALKGSSLVADGLYHAPTTSDMAKDGAKAGLQGVIDILKSILPNTAPMHGNPLQQSPGFTPSGAGSLLHADARSYNAWGDTPPLSDDTTTGPITRRSPSVTEAVAGLLTDSSQDVAMMHVTEQLVDASPILGRMDVDSIHDVSPQSGILSEIGGAVKSLWNAITSLPSMLWSAISSLWAKPAKQNSSPAQASAKPAEITASPTLTKLFDGLQASSDGTLTVSSNRTFDWEGKTWESGSTFERDDDGSLFLLKGTVLEPRMEGLTSSTGGLVPVLYTTSSGGDIQPVGLDLSRVHSGASFKVATETQVAPGLTIRVGGFTVEANNTFSFDNATIFKSGNGNSWSMSYKPINASTGQKEPEQILNIDLHADHFAVTVPQYKLADGDRASLINATLTGKITDSGAIFNTGSIQNVVVSLSNSMENAHGTGSVAIDDQGGMHFQVRMTGEGVVPGFGQAGSSAGKSQSQSTPTSLNNKVFILDYDVKNNAAHVQGSFWLLDTSKAAFGEGTQFQFADKITLQFGSLAYSRNDSNGFFQIKNGGLIAPEGAVGRDLSKKELYLFGSGGTVEAVARWDSQWNLTGVWSAGSNVPLHAEISGNIFNGGNLKILGLGAEDFSVKLTATEINSPTKVVYGLTSGRSAVVVNGLETLLPLVSKKYISEELTAANELTLGLASASTKVISWAARNTAVLTAFGVSESGDVFDHGPTTINITKQLVSWVTGEKPDNTIGAGEVTAAKAVEVMAPFIEGADKLGERAEAFSLDQMRGLKNSQSSGIMIGVVGLGLGFGKQYLEGLGGLFGQRSMAEYDKDSSDQHPFGGVIGDSKKLIQSADMLIHPIQTIEKSIDDNGLALGWGVGLGQVAGTALLVSHFAADGIEGYSKIGGEVDGSFAIKSSAARWGSAAFSVGKATLQEAGNMIIPKFGE